jgi:hypothetical protein
MPALLGNKVVSKGRLRPHDHSSYPWRTQINNPNRPSPSITSVTIPRLAVTGEIALVNRLSELVPCRCISL